MGAFQSAAERQLLRNEAEHCLTLAVCSALRAGEKPDVSEPYLAVVRDGDDIVATAVHASSEGLLLTGSGQTAVIEAVADDLATRQSRLAAVQGPPEASVGFARLWSQRRSRPWWPRMRQRVYEADSVREPVPAAGGTAEREPIEGQPTFRRAAGQLRPATEADRRLLGDWVTAFNEEVPDDSAVAAEQVVDRLLTPPGRAASAGSALWLWDDGRPVAMAAHAGPTPNGIRVLLVYTPPELRRRGYATATVAALSQRLLASGRRCCFVFADRDQPASIRLCEGVGYRRVADADSYWLS